MFFKRFFERPLVLPALIVGVAFLIGLFSIGWGVGARGTESTITTTGSTSYAIKADEAKWTLEVQRTVRESGIPQAQSIIARDAQTVVEFFERQKLAASDIALSVVQSEQNYSSDEKAPTTYTVGMSITVRTTDVDKIKSLVGTINDLSAAVSQGTTVAPHAPQYYISTLPKLRVMLMGLAVQDARARAEQIAKAGGSSLGALKNASSGVTQVLAPNSIDDVGDYGTYDTYTIDKVVMVTARATFYVR